MAMIRKGQVRNIDGRNSGFAMRELHGLPHDGLGERHAPLCCFKDRRQPLNNDPAEKIALLGDAQTSAGRDVVLRHKSQHHLVEVTLAMAFEKLDRGDQCGPREGHGAHVVLPR
jgi:hypothetical protein